MSITPRYGEIFSRIVRVYERKSGEQERDVTEERINRITAGITKLDSIDRSIKESLAS